MKKGFGLILISVGLISLSFATYAGNKPCAATFTLGEGYYRFAPKRHNDNTGVPFASLGYNLTEHWGIEGLLGFFNTKSSQAIDDDKQVKGTLFEIGVIYRLPIYRCIEPYLLAGPGILSMNPNGNDANTEGNINGGVGAQLFFSEIVSLRVEARDIYTIVGGKNDLFLNAGISFLF